MSDLPLSGVRIVELTQIFAGPYATLILGDWGAEVIKLETIQTMQPGSRGQYAHVSQDLMNQYAKQQMVHQTYPGWKASDRAWNLHSGFTSVNRSKKSMTVDLRQPKGLEILRQLLETADVFIENNVPETLTKLNISYEWIKSLNPHIIMVRMPAFGLTGPYENYRCLGLHVDGVSGHSFIKGFPDEELSKRGDTVAPDAAAGASAAFAVMAALWHRKRTGEGQMMEISLAENFIPLMAEPILEYTMTGRVPKAIGNRDPACAPQGIYPCMGERKWLAIAIHTDDEWRKLCTIMERPELGSDPHFATALERWRHHDDLDAILAEWTSQHDQAELFERLQGHGLAAGPLIDDLDILRDRHLQERAYFQQMDHAEIGAYFSTGPLWRMSKTPNTLRIPAPRLGEHNDYVYREILGFSEEEIKELEAAGHIGTEMAAHVL